MYKTVDVLHKNLIITDLPIILKIFKN